MPIIKKIFAAFLFLYTYTLLAAPAAAPEKSQLSVWVNEAIVATYTFDYKNFLQRQKEIAKYFSVDGWTAYSLALKASGLPETVKKKLYFVSSVAQLPPVIKDLGNNQWQAVMPLLVLYKNPQEEQKQSLEIRITFSAAPGDQGVRGFVIKSLQSKVIAPSCLCQQGS